MRVNNLNGQPDGLADAVRSDELPSKNKRCVPRFITYTYDPEVWTRICESRFRQRRASQCFRFPAIDGALLC